MREIENSYMNHMYIENATRTNAWRDDGYVFESLKFDKGEIIYTHWCMHG